VSVATRPSDEPILSVVSFVALRRRYKTLQKRFGIESLAEQNLAFAVSRILRLGIAISATMVFLGGIIYLARHGTLLASYQVFIGEPLRLRNLSGILSSAFSFQGRGIIQLGLLVLLATPIARVAVALYGFYVIGDRLYVAVAGIVLVTLLVSIVSI
jgi:uncharacterized membrane protein